MSWKTLDYHKKNSLRITRGNNKGKMPHELSEESFYKWLILNGMDEDLYIKNIQKADGFMVERENSKTKTVSNTKLTPDQKGWAMLDYPEHWNSGGSWIISATKQHKPVPSNKFEIKRSSARIYMLFCQCEEPEDKIYGTVFDGRVLVQCRKCKTIKTT